MPLHDLDLPSLPHVYPIREDSLLLAASLRARPGELFLEVGCGLGLASFQAARAGARVVASDVNPHALRGLAREARRRRVALDVVRTDLLSGLGSFDVIACNPPYLPTQATPDPDAWHERALDGGPDGHGFVRRFLATAGGHLRPGGRVYVLVASLPEAPVRRPGLPAPAPGLVVTDLAGDRVLPRETLWVLELSGAGAGGSSDARATPRSGGSDPTSA